LSCWQKAQARAVRFLRSVVGVGVYHSSGVAREYSSVVVIKDEQAAGLAVVAEQASAAAVSGGAEVGGESGGELDSADEAIEAEPEEVEELDRRARVDVLVVRAVSMDGEKCVALYE
jgi:hypothetical protein